MVFACFPSSSSAPMGTTRPVPEHEEGLGLAMAWHVQPGGSPHAQRPLLHVLRSHGRSTAAGSSQQSSRCTRRP